MAWQNVIAGKLWHYNKKDTIKDSNIQEVRRRVALMSSLKAERLRLYEEI